MRFFESIIIIVVLFSCAEKDLRIYSNKNILDGKIELVSNESNVTFDLYHRGIYLIPIKIKDRIFNFIVDTGTKDIIISKKAASSLGYEIENLTSNVEKIKTTKTEEIDLYLGPFKFNKIQLTLVPDNNNSTDFSSPVDGVAGYELLKYFKITFDGINERVTLDLNASIDENAFKFELDTFNGIKVKYRLNFKNRNALFDTGNPFGLLVNTNFNFRSELNNIIVEETLTHSGVVKQVYPYKVEIGDTIIENSKVILDPWVNSQLKDNIGIGFFKDKAISINYPNRVMRIF